MKTVIISTFPPRKCGIGIYTKKLVDEIKEINIISLKEHTYTDIRVKGMIDGHLSSFLKTAQHIKKKGYTSVLIEHEYAFYNPVHFLIFLARLRLDNIRITLEMHTIVSYDDLIKKNIFRLYNTVLFAMSDKIIVHTSYAKQKLLGSGLFKKKISIVPLAIPPEIREEKKQTKIINLLCFGFIWYDKGTDIAVKAFGGLENVKLTIAGSINPSATGKQKAFFEKVKKMAAQHKNIQVIDKFVSEEEKIKLYKNADFIVMPYRMISQSAVLTEVWAMGKIPIASDLAPLKEEIKNKHGVLFRNENAQDLKKATLNLAKDRTLQQNLQKNIHKLCTERSFSKIAARLMKETQ